MKQTKLKELSKKLAARVKKVESRAAKMEVPAPDFGTVTITTANSDDKCIVCNSNTHPRFALNGIVPHAHDALCIWCMAKGIELATGWSVTRAFVAWHQMSSAKKAQVKPSMYVKKG